MLLRYSVSAVFGVASSLLMLWLMVSLVSGDSSGGIDDGGLPPGFDFIRVKEQAELQLRERLLPEPPDEPQPLPTPRIDLRQPDIKPVVPKLSLVMKLALPADIGGAPYLGPMVQGEMDRGFMILSRTPPQYPFQARRQKIEGWVKLAFTVTETGTVEDVQVVESEPVGVFDRAATRAVYKWTFKPRIVAGSPVPGRAVQTLEFKLNR